ncbi:MAG: hypothetical protein IJO45_00480, partial [Oscillospiraceae bacterium]|nr:hypothetical protein [Oscillospiraceae bacterium]
RVAFLLTKWKQKALQRRNDPERSFVDDCRTVHELPAGAPRPINWNLFTLDICVDFLTNTLYNRIVINEKWRSSYEAQQQTHHFGGLCLLFDLRFLADL